MRTADFKGPMGEAWTLPLKVGIPAQYAAVYAALIHAPNAHPLWHWHLLNLVSLRDIVGVRPATKRYPEAEYELSVFAIDPKENPDPDEPGWSLLQPFDVLEQFHGIDAYQARQLGELSTRACVDGVLVPDSDFRQSWSETIRSTVEHFRKGKH